MKKLIFLAGLPGTGKSTFIRHMSLDDKAVIISSDEIRFSIQGTYEGLIPDMKVVYQTMVDKANELLKKEEDVTIIFDSTFLDDNRRNFFLDQLPEVDETIIYLLKAHDPNLIFQRNHRRRKDKWVPEDIIREMMTRYKNPSPENEHRYTKIVEVYVDEKH